MTKRRSVGCWVNDGDRACDYGLVTLDTSFDVGSLGLLIPSDATLDATTAYVAGYPGDRGTPPGTQLFGAPAGGGIHDYTSKRLFYAIDTAGGQSGSAIYRFWNGVRVVIGVHAGFNPASGLNAGPRITKYRHDLIRGWQDADQ